MKETIVAKNDEQLDLRVKLPLRLLASPADAERLLKLSVYKETDSIAILLGVPKTQAVREAWSWWPKGTELWFCGDNLDFEKIAITLNKSTYLPKQIHTLDAANNEIVYRFDSIEFQSEKARISEWYPNDGMDWKELQGYTSVVVK